MELQDAVSNNDSEIYFASARFSSGRREPVSVGDYLWSSLGRQGRCYLLRLDALYIPMHRRQLQHQRNGAGPAVSRMASVSVFYPTSYASHDVNYALRLKRVSAEGDSGAACVVGFHRVFAPPVEYELLRHPRPLTMSLKDFFECIGPGLESHSPEVWSAKGFELPDFMASSGQRPRKSGKARILVLSVSAFNRLHRCTLGHRLFGWSREDALQCVGDNRLFQCPCGTRLFFCRRKHPLYHVNRHSARQESMAPKRKGLQQSLSLRTEREALVHFHLPCEPSQPPPPAMSHARRRKLASDGSPSASPQPRGRGRRKRPPAAVAAAAAAVVASVGKRRRRNHTKQRRTSPPTSPSPPALSPAAQPTPSSASTVVSKQRRQQRRSRPRLRADGAVATLAATIDSVIATVLSGGSSSGDVSGGGGAAVRDSLFQMRLETISPPDSPCPKAAVGLSPLSPPPPPPSSSLGLDFDLQFHRQQYYQQQQQQQQQHLLLHHHSQQQQQQHQNLFRLPHRDLQLQQQSYLQHQGYLHQHQQQQSYLQHQQNQSYLQAWGPQSPALVPPVSWQSPLAPTWLPQKPGSQSCMPPFMTLPQSQLQPPLLPTSQPSAATLVPIIIGNPLALSAAGLFNLSQLSSIGH